MMLRKLVQRVLLFTAVACTAKSGAVQASPHIVNLTQPDGSKITTFIRGDEFNHWYEDPSGYVILRNPENVYVYAQPDVQERSLMQPTDRVVGKDSPAPDTPKGFLSPPGLVRQDGFIRPDSQGLGANLRANHTGIVRNLVVLLRFSDHNSRSLPTKDDIEILFNAVGGDAKLAPTGSVRDVYLENSYNKLDLRSTVTDWITLPHTEAYYANGHSGLDRRIHEALISGLELIDPKIDFRDFDGDGDKLIDAITFIHSGYGAEWGGVDDSGADEKARIWSHQSFIPTWRSKEGVLVSNYDINPGLWGTQGNVIGRIGVICHETGHYFGLPDLYDYSKRGEGAGSWCLMANSWGFDGSQLHPPHMSAWSKIQLGWAAATELTTNGTYTLEQVETTRAGFTPTIYRISHGFAQNEYLLVENRQASGIESDIPQGGLAVWHINDNVPRNDNPGHPLQPGWPQNGNHYKVALLQADTQYHLERRNPNAPNRGDNTDLFHADNIDHLDSSTVPNTNGYQQGLITKTGIKLSQISKSAQTMSFTFGIEPIPTPIEKLSDSESRDVNATVKRVLKLVEKLAPKDEISRVILQESMLHDIQRSWDIADSQGQFGSGNVTAIPELNLQDASSLINDPTWRKNTMAMRKAQIFVGDRIFGGRPAEQDEFPYCVAIGNGNSICCTGTLIAPNLVVTAAHCAGCVEWVYLGLDATNRLPGKTFSVLGAPIVHPNYNPVTHQHDIALLILSQSTGVASLAKLPTSNTLQTGHFVHLEGYGFTETGKIGIQMTVRVPISNVGCPCGSCQEKLCVFPDTEFTAGGNGADTCNGDSGGPALDIKEDGTAFLEGVTSRGMSCGSGGIYVRVSSYVNWIVETAREHGILVAR